jgi:hypothetical protein
MQGQARAKLIRFVPQAAILLGCAGCQSPGDWWRSRGLDLWDCVPAAVMRDQELGFSMSVRATLFAQTGIGVYGLNALSEDAPDYNSYGMALGRWGPRWRESVIHLIIGSDEYQELVGRNWPGGPDGRFLYQDERLVVRKSGNVLIILPLSGLNPHDLRLAKFPDWYSIPDSELCLFVGYFGLRIGPAPAQFVDFLCGFVNLDPMGDDAPPRDPERRSIGRACAEG